MKISLLLTSTILLLHCSLFGQSSFYVNSLHAVEEGSVNSEITPDIIIRNPHNGTNRIHWEIISQQTEDDWSFIVCDKDCGIENETKGSFTLAPGEVLHDFRVLFRPNGRYGTSAVDIILYSDKNNTDTKNIRFTASTSALSNNDINATSNRIAPKLYPNPAIEYISLDQNSTNVGKVEIYNMIGRLLHTFTVKSVGEKYNISNLPRGMYMSRIIDKEGKVIATQRISKHNP